MTPDDTEDGPFSSRTKIAEDFGVRTRTIRRWEQRPELNFPKVRMFNGRGYFSAPEMSEFKRRCAKVVATKVHAVGNKERNTTIADTAATETAKAA